MDRSINGGRSMAKHQVWILLVPSMVIGLVIWCKSVAWGCAVAVRCCRVQLLHQCMWKGPAVAKCHDPCHVVEPQQLLLYLMRLPLMALIDLLRLVLMDWSLHFSTVWICNGGSQSIWSRGYRISHILIQYIQWQCMTWFIHHTDSIRNTYILCRGRSLLYAHNGSQDVAARVAAWETSSNTGLMVMHGMVTWSCYCAEKRIMRYVYRDVYHFAT